MEVKRRQAVKLLDDKDVRERNVRFGDQSTYFVTYSIDAFSKSARGMRNESLFPGGETAMRGREIVWRSVWRPVAATMVALMLLAGGTRANRAGHDGDAGGNGDRHIGRRAWQRHGHYHQSEHRTDVCPPDERERQLRVHPACRRACIRCRWSTQGFASTVTNGVQATVNTTNRRMCN